MIIAEIDEIEWDEEVDIVCVGTESAALAVAVAAEAAALEVLLTGSRGRGDAATLAGRLGLTDDSAEYLDCVTTDTGSLVRPTAPAELAVRRGDERIWPDLGPDISFSGSALRDWAMVCLDSPYGLLRTSVCAADAPALRVGAPDPAAPVDLGRWLSERARILDIGPREQTVLKELVFLRGLVVGAVIDKPDGSALVRAAGGLVAETGTGARLPRLEPAGVRGADTVELVVRARPFSRFARLELLVSGIGDGSEGGAQLRCEG